MSVRAVIIHTIYSGAETTVLRILLWAEMTMADFSSNTDFSEVGRTICLCRPKRLGQTIDRCGPNLSWAEPSIGVGRICHGPNHLGPGHHNDTSQTQLKINP